MFAYEAAYETDLAFIHDAGFTQLAESAATLALEILDGGPLGPVLELGCGGGVTARRLADAGHEVHGIDISEQQVALARGRVPTGHFQTGPLLDVQTPPGCIAVLGIGEVLNYAFDPRADDSRLPGLFARLAAGLVPGGLLLFDSAGPGRAPGGTVRNFAQGDDWSILHEARESRDTGRLIREITTFRRVEGAWRRDHETHRLHLHEPHALVTYLQAAGFAVEIRPGYDGVRFAPGLDVFVARRLPGN